MIDYSELGAAADVWIFLFRDPPFEHGVMNGKIVPPGFGDPKVLDAVDLARKAGKKVFFPGHGEEISLSDTRDKFVLFISDCPDSVRKAKESGWAALSVAGKGGYATDPDEIAVKKLDWLCFFLAKRIAEDRFEAIRQERMKRELAKDPSPENPAAPSSRTPFAFAASPLKRLMALWRGHAVPKDRNPDDDAPGPLAGGSQPFPGLRTG